MKKVRCTDACVDRERVRASVYVLAGRCTCLLKSMLQVFDPRLQNNHLPTPSTRLYPHFPSVLPPASSAPPLSDSNSIVVLSIYLKLNRLTQQWLKFPPSSSSSLATAVPERHVHLLVSISLCPSTGASWNRFPPSTNDLANWTPRNRPLSSSVT